MSSKRKAGAVISQTKEEIRFSKMMTQYNKKRGRLLEKRRSQGQSEGLAALARL